MNNSVVFQAGTSRSGGDLYYGQRRDPARHLRLFKG
jgi:hypothetical protein